MAVHSPALARLAAPQRWWRARGSRDRLFRAGRRGAMAWSSARGRSA